MGFFGKLFGRKSGSVSSSLELFREVYGGRASSSGVSVNWANSVEVPTVLACTRTYMNGTAQVPWRLYREVGAGKEVAVDHSLHRLLYRRPNSWQTSFEFRETIAFHLVLTGNAFVWIGRVGSNREIRALEPIEPGRVEVNRDRDGALNYVVKADDGAKQVFSSNDIWHLRGPSWDSWRGLDIVKLARDAIGLAIAIERSQADFHRNGARVSGLLSMKNSIAPEKFEFLSAWLDKHSTGGERASKPLILDNEADFKSFQMTGADAQLLETRKHQVEEICRAMNVMPIMVGHADKTATYASAEQMFLAHVVHTLMPFFGRIEQSADVNLLTDDERRQGYYTKLNPNALMRGAAKDRGEYFAKALGAGGSAGWMTQNDVRRLEDMDPIEGGDVLFGPSNATPGEQPNE